MKYLLLVLVLFCAKITSAQNYTFLTYNVENLFDADENAVFDDYKSVDKDGNPLYTKEDVYTKIMNVVAVLQKYNSGKGPEIIAFAELESDYTPSHINANTQEFLKKWSNTTFKEMMSTGFNDQVQDLPSELLLLKALEDAGLTGYQILVGESELKNGKPINVQKNAVFSKFPIDYKKSSSHFLEEARPIVEAWIKVKDQDLVVFANHWKSGAGQVKMENIRLQNAEVLRTRLNELKKTNPNLDYIIAGDFNAEYNQHLVLKGATKTALRDILLVSGNETKVARTKTDSLYNLWYEFPYEKRGSEAYKGKLGSLMNIILPSSMYDSNGISYVDNSYGIAAFRGMNVYPFAFIPKRWSSYGIGSGYSDHLPVTMEFTLANKAEMTPKALVNPGMESENDGKDVIVVYEKIEPTQVLKLKDIAESDLTQEKYFNEYVYAELVLNDKDLVKLGDIWFKVYPESREIKSKLEETKNANKGLVKFYGRLTLYKTTWEFIIESEDYILN